MMPTLEFTEHLVRTKFEGQHDDAGVPMADHMMRVWQRVQHLDEDTQHIAWLHDIVEDTDVTITELISLGYSTDVVEAVYLLTKPDKMPYADYIDHLISSGDRRAITVKLADNADNTDPKRWLYLNPYKAQALSKRYHGVKEKLIGALK
jgi:(p)ppGpp synthase/HD superfamily hydrolase